MNTSWLSAKIHTSRKSYYNLISETKVSLADWAFRHHSDSDDEIRSYLMAVTAVVDIAFIPHDNPEISL